MAKEKVRRYGFAIEDLPIGATGMPQTVLEDKITAEDMKRMIEALEKNNGNDDGSRIIRGNPSTGV